MNIVLFTLVLGVSAVQIEQVTEPIDHAETPTWDNRTGLLLFVDVYEGRVLSYNPLTGLVRSISLLGTVASVIPTKSSPDLLVVGVNRTVAAVEWDGKGEKGRVVELTTVSERYPTSRLNDGKADSRGRLWIGTMGQETPTGVTLNEGSLYSISRDNLHNPLEVLHPVNISNGLAWSKANTDFYYIDTFSFQVWGFDYDAPSGSISNKRVVFDLAQHPELSGFPDGMTIDADDNLWVALNSGWTVVKVNPRTQEVLQVVRLPARDVTSVNWGGAHLGILYVTTSRHSLTEEEIEQQPGAGAVFAVTYLGTRGLPPYEVDIIDGLNDFS